VGRQHDVSPTAGEEHLTSGLSLWLSLPLCFSNPLHGLPRSLHRQWGGEAWLRKWTDVVESKCPPPTIYAGPLTTGFPFTLLNKMDWNHWKRVFSVLDFIPIMTRAYNHVPASIFSTPCSCSCSNGLTKIGTHCPSHPHLHTY